MDWTLDSTGRTYTLTQGAYHAIVLHASRGEWIVLLNCGTKPVTEFRCTSLKEAQLWTDEQLQRLTSRQ